MKSVSLILFCLWISTGGMVLFGQVIDYRTAVRIEKGKRITEKSFQIQINNKDQEGLASISIPYSKSQDLVLLEAYVVDRTGKTVRKLKKKEVSTRSNISHSAFYEDDFVQTFQLNWHEFPYQIHYTYRITEKEFIYVARWQPVLYEKVPTIRAALELEVPADYPIAIDYPGGLDYQTERQKDQVLHRWEIGAVKAPVPETFAPPFPETVPLVTVIPQEFDYATKGSMASWGDYGYWHEKLNEGLDVLPAAEGRVVDKLVQGISDKREIIRRLYHHLQDHTRYVNVAIDVGGLKPYPAAYVAKNKYGDCKALTIYMKALLKQAGIPSHYVVIYAGSNPVRVKAELPGQQFNHVILGVPLQGDTVWLENTAGYLPYNYLGTFTQNRLALWVDGADSRLVRTPAMQLPQLLENTTYRYQLEESGRGKVQIDQRLRGKSFESLLFGQRELSEKEFREKIEESIRLENAGLTDWEVVREHRDQTDLELKSELSLEEQFREIGRMRVLQPPAMEIPDLESPADRSQSLRFPYPINRQDEIIYELPFLSKYRVELPEATTLETPFGKYSESYRMEEQHIVVDRHFQLYRGDYPLAVYAELYDFIQSVHNARKRSAVILKSGADE